MSKAEKFIQEYTNNCSNVYLTDSKLDGLGGYVSRRDFSPWLTPDQARSAVEIAREEVIDKLRKWVESKNERDSFTFGYIDRHFDELLKEAMKDE